MSSRNIDRNIEIFTMKRKSLSMVWNGYTADLEESSGQNSRFGTPGFLSE